MLALLLLLIVGFPATAALAAPGDPTTTVSPTVAPTSSMTPTTPRPVSSTVPRSSVPSTSIPRPTTTLYRPPSTTVPRFTTTVTTAAPTTSTTAATTTTAAPTTTAVATTTTTTPVKQADAAGSSSGRLPLVVGGLLAVGAAIGALTFLFWRHTRPEYDDYYPYDDELDDAFVDPEALPVTRVTPVASEGESLAAGAVGAAAGGTATSVLTRSAYPPDENATVVVKPVSELQGAEGSSNGSPTNGSASGGERPSVAGFAGAAAAGGAALAGGRDRDEDDDDDEASRRVPAPVTEQIPAVDATDMPDDELDDDGPLDDLHGDDSRLDAGPRIVRRIDDDEFNHERVEPLDPSPGRYVIDDLGANGAARVPAADALESDGWDDDRYVVDDEHGGGYDPDDRYGFDDHDGAGVALAESVRPVPAPRYEDELTGEHELADYDDEVDAGYDDGYVIDSHEVAIQDDEDAVYLPDVEPEPAGVGPSSVTILGPMRPGTGSDDFDDFDDPVGLEPDPLEIVTLEDIEQARTTGRSGRDRG